MSEIAPLPARRSGLAEIKSIVPRNLDKRRYRVLKPIFSRNCLFYRDETGRSSFLPGFEKGTRMHKVRLAVLAGAAALPAMALAQSNGGSAQGDVSVTIYNNNLALVQDVRQVNLPNGRSRQEFPDVSASIRPETVTLSGEGFGIVEQNFDYDLLSPAKIMENAVGQTITLVRTNPATGAETREQAVVLAANGGVVLQIGNRIEVLRDDGLPVRVIFDRVPPGLRARPTLSVNLDSARGGRRPVSLRYLTNGLGWSADYVALYNESAGTIDMQGWVTLTTRPLPQAIRHRLCASVVSPKNSTAGLMAWSRSR